LNFQSILYPNNHIRKEIQKEPSVFRDLNIDHIINKIIHGKKDYNLKPFYLEPLHDINTIEYRLEIMRDLEQQPMLEQIKSFSQKVFFLSRKTSAILERLTSSEKYYHNYLEKGNFLDAAKCYCYIVNFLTNRLASSDIKSRGLVAFNRYLSLYTASESFRELQKDTDTLKANLSNVKYTMLIKSGSIRVRKFESETDYEAEIEQFFKKFQQGSVEDYRKELSQEPYAAHIEAGVLDLVAGLYPKKFADIDSFCIKHRDYLDKAIVRFSREVQFYISYLEYIEKFKNSGLYFCYPKVSSQNKEIYSNGSFDLALADKLHDTGAPVICNDFFLEGQERIIVVSGPNQGGKTTFARTFGQLHYLASIGCPVPGQEARLFLPDGIFTHFEREEDINDLVGKLQNDLVRIREIFSRATGSSIIIINEILASTTLRDAQSIGKKIIEKIVQLNALCVFVTFLSELSSFNENTVSMVSNVVPENPAVRTYRIVRKKADGRAHAISIVEKHRLTYEALKERVKS